MFGKIIDGRLEIAGRIVKEGNTTITNPTEEQLLLNGYLPITYTEKPQYDKEEEKLIEKYEIQDDTISVSGQDEIVVSYEIVALTDEEYNAVIQAEIVAEENKITPRNIRNAIKGDTFALDKITEIESNIYQLRQKLRTVETNEE